MGKPGFPTPLEPPDPAPQAPRTYAAWPVGCVVAGLSLLVMVNAFGLFGILAAAGNGPRWLQVGAPLFFSLLAPLAQIIGWWFARRRNPYAARVLLWGFGLTLAFGAIITVVLNVIDVLTLRR
ncbi:MAG: ZIP family metal transporter [Chloroflexaceae bacterium]|nr:ZIP family metal transporter [Chloroflexaceae bacterium]